LRGLFAQGRLQGGHSVLRTKTKPFCDRSAGSGCAWGARPPPLICFAKGIRDRSNEIINGVRYGINSARIESVNAAIKRLQAKACGLSGAGHLFLKMRQKWYKTPRASASRFETAPKWESINE